MACKTCNKKGNCVCKKGIKTQYDCGQNTPICATADECTSYTYTGCSIYNGETISCQSAVIARKGDRLDAILQRLSLAFCLAQECCTASETPFNGVGLPILADNVQDAIEEVIRLIADSIPQYTISDGGDGTFSLYLNGTAVNTVDKANLTDNGDGTYTFDNGNGTPITIDLNCCTAFGVPYDNTSSGLNATNVQDAIDEIASTIPSVNSYTLVDNGDGTFSLEENGIVISPSVSKSSLTNNNDGTYTFDNGDGNPIVLDLNCCEAIDIFYDNSDSGLTSTNVKEAIDELATSIPIVNTYNLIDNGDGTFALEENGSVIVPNITKGSLVDNGNGSYTYDNGNGTPVTFSIGNSNIYTIVDNANGSFSLEENGLVVGTVNKATLTNNGSGSYTFDNGDGSPITFNVGGTLFYSVTKAQLDTLISSNTLVEGATYWINDRGDVGLFFKAVSTNWLDFENGYRIMRVPIDYNVISVGANTMHGIWQNTLSVVAGDYVIWGGKVWENLNGNIGAENDQFTLDSEWQLVPKTDNNVYKNFGLGCNYDYDNDWIAYCWDKKGNYLGMSYQMAASSGIIETATNFSDWNINKEMLGNQVFYICNNTNSPSTIRYNTCTGAIFSNKNNGNIEYNSNVGSIYSNSNLGSIYNNSNEGGIFSNTNIGSVSSNSNTGSVNSNSNIGEIFRNTNIGSVNSNSNIGRVNRNSNIGDIFRNTNRGELSRNSNNGAIDNNDNQGGIVSNPNKGDISSNQSNVINIENNSNDGTINYNDNNGDIENNSNNGSIVGNQSNVTDIQNNSNNGTIDNNNNVGTIDNNSNNGFISANENGNIEKNRNNGTILGNGTDVGDIYRNINNGDINNNNNVGHIQMNSNNGAIVNASSSVDNILNNTNNGIIDGTSLSGDIADTIVDKI